MHDREGFKFDLRTRRFLEGRWKTKLGMAVLKEVTSGIRESLEIRVVLERYLLEHPENSDPYGFPYYPLDAMTPDDFWVITSDDLRGAHFYREDFKDSQSLAKKSLGYCVFHGCNLRDANMEMSELSYARFEKCDFRGTMIAVAGGFSTTIRDCNLTGACLAEVGFVEADFSGSDLREAYLDGARFIDITVDYESRIDERLRSSYPNRPVVAPAKRPDILRAFRIAYERSQVWDVADRFLYRERTERRKHVVWPSVWEQKTLGASMSWFADWFSGAVAGYGTKPGRLLLTGLVVSLSFATAYLIAGPPQAQDGPWGAILESVYLSFTTFATLGYGDVTYPSARPWMRIVTTTEAWLGAILIAGLATALARKAFR